MSTIVDSAARPAAQTDERAQTQRAWRAAAATLAVGILGLIGLFWEPAVAAVNVWTDSATYNHCYLIVPIVAYLIWERRVIFAQTRPAPTYLIPALAVVIGSAAWLVANTATVFEVQQFAMFGILQCLLLAVLGWRVYFALARVTAAVTTISSTEQPRERSLIGLAKPCRKGPKASAFPNRCTNL